MLLGILECFHAYYSESTNKSALETTMLLNVARCLLGAHVRVLCESHEVSGMRVPEMIERGMHLHSGLSLIGR